MATLVLQVAGQALGTLLGGPIGGIIGQAAGALAGSAIDTALLGSGSNKPVEGPRLKTLDGISSTEGAPIPRVYGRARLGGQVIWATRFEEVATTRESGGGKGGGSRNQKQTTYAYYANVAIALCEGPIAFVRRVWADGKELDLSTVTMRTHAGSEDQQPDPLIVAKVGDLALVPAYRGTAYVVFERLALENFGNRLPQLSFEVVRPVSALAANIRAVALIPGSGEFAYDTLAVRAEQGYGASSSENRHVLTGVTDWAASLDQLQALCPRLEAVSLVVSWFGDDLRAGSCTVAPRVEIRDKTTTGADWQVAGLSRADARLVSQVDGRPAFGGTPSDDSVLRAIADLKARGLKVIFYPFIMMDVPAGNALPDPWTGAQTQAAYPWRGRITCERAPGQPGSPDGTVAAGAQVNAFFGNGATDWSFRRLIRHYANLCATAGGVDGFILCSELAALTRVRSASGVYPAVSQFVALAADVRSVLGAATKIGYAADWTEYGAHVLAGGSEVRFPLDPLFTNPNIDFVGIDWYVPLADWREGRSHLDAAIAVDALDPAYLLSRVAGGEAFDWYYASTNARNAQTRTPITDGLGKPWMFRQKDLAGWWSNAHIERVGGIETAQTGWVPGSKPIWLTEIGFPAVDLGPNAPNVFPDPKSSENAFPYFSRGFRDDLAQSRGLEATLAAFDPGLPDHPAPLNPVNAGNGLRMVDPSRVFVWSWDARPYPAFPQQAGVWADGVNWTTGHWINGRLEGMPLDQLVRAIARDYAGMDVETNGLSGFVDGYVLDRTLSARGALEPLSTFYGFDAVASGGRVRFIRRDGSVVKQLTSHDLVPDRDGQLSTLTRAQETELPREVSFTFVDSERDYRSATVTSRRLEGGSRRESRNEVAVATQRNAAQRLSDVLLQDVWLGRETLNATLRPGLIDLEIGDILNVPAAGDPRWYRITRLSDPGGRKLEARAVEPAIFNAAPAPLRLVEQETPVTFGAPYALVLDLPVTAGTPVALQYLAASAQPWPGQLTVWRSADGQSFDPVASVALPAVLGVTTTVLPAGPLWRWDRANSLTIRLAAGKLSSRDPASVLAGRNLMAIRRPDGSIEIIAFATATLVADRTWRLSNLLRGLAASEVAASTASPAGSTIVLLDDAVIPLASGNEALGRPWRYRLTPAGQDVGAISATSFDAKASAIALLPLAPTRPGARRTSGGVQFTWIRRTRTQGDAWEPAEVPLGEDTEAYELDIMAGATRKRTLSSATPGAIYGLGDELADFGTAQTTLTIRLFQMSTAVGRGRALETTIPVA